MLAGPEDGISDDEAPVAPRRRLTSAGNPAGGERRACDRRVGSRRRRATSAAHRIELVPRVVPVPTAAHLLDNSIPLEREQQELNGRVDLLPPETVVQLA